MVVLINKLLRLILCVFLPLLLFIVVVEEEEGEEKLTTSITGLVVVANANVNTAKESLMVDSGVLFSFSVK